MSSREGAIKAAMADGIPIHKGYVAEVLDRAADAHQIHYADQCPRGKARLQAAKRAKREADERCIALVAERDALRERLEALEEIRQRVAGGWLPNPNWKSPTATTPGFWTTSSRDDHDPNAPDISPEVYAVLWPSTEAEA